MPVPRAARLIARALFAVLGATVAAHLAYSGFDVGRASHARFFDYAVVAIGLAAVAGLCVLRAVVVREHRAAWLAFAAGVLSFAAGGMYYGVVLYTMPAPPFPSWADLGLARGAIPPCTPG